MTPTSLRISVIIPTRDRASLLRGALDSLGRQTLPRDDYEVVVVDDGSIDATERVCGDQSEDLHLRSVRIPPSGIAAAKNLGLFVSRAPISLFFDDDDVATPTLLEAHLQAHERYPDQNVAVLGLTTWASGLDISPVMDYVTGPGAFLFSYGNLTPRQMLDFTYFWGGRSSCKRSFLATKGIFHQSFRFGCEDIELAYRLSRFGFRVFYEPTAVSHMVRPVTTLEFCARCERQGWSQYLFSRLHPDPRIQDYCEIEGAEERLNAVGDSLDGMVHRVGELEASLQAEGPPSEGGPGPDQLLRELHRLYREVFLGFRARGIVAAARADIGGQELQQRVDQRQDRPRPDRDEERMAEPLATGTSRDPTA